MSRPIVIIPCDTKVIDGLTFDAVGRKYSAAVAEVADCQPLLAPLGPSMLDMNGLLEIADGILLSGALSNVHPSHYGLDEPPLNEKALDHERDGLTLPLVREALHRKLPLFAICRGFQELNVALGGKLHQAVHDQEGLGDHREKKELTLEERWGPVHSLTLTGKLKEWVGEDEIRVNSLHGQGIKEVGKMLTPEAFAEDGLVEAVRGPDDHPFCLGVQWHPEWNATQNPVSVKLFRRFGTAAGAKPL